MDKFPYYYIVWEGKISGTKWIYPVIFKKETSAKERGEYLVTEGFATRFFIRGTHHKSIDSFEGDHVPHLTREDCG